MNAEMRRELKECGVPLIIYGAGIAGEVLLDELTRSEIHVVAFCDNNINKAGKDFCGRPVVHVSKLKRLYPEALFVISAADITDVQRKLDTLGYKNHLLGGTILESVNIHNRTYSKPPEYVEYAVATCINCHRNLSENDTLFARSIDLIITQRCSLRCRDCSNLAQYYTAPVNFHEEDLYREIDKLCLTFDEINEIRLIGGEPFMHPQASKIADYLARKANIHKIVIFSNGTIPFTPAMTEILKNRKILVLFSDYGANVSTALQKNEEICRKKNIAFLSTKLEGWVDCCSMKPHGENEQDIRRKFEECCSKNVYSVAQGRLYRCPFLANAFQLKGIPDRKEDYIDFMEDDPCLKSKIKDFLVRKENMLSCDFCNGRPLTAPAIVEPAVQLKKPLDYVMYL